MVEPVGGVDAAPEQGEQCGYGGEGGEERHEHGADAGVSHGPEDGGSGDAQGAEAEGDGGAGDGDGASGGGSGGDRTHRGVVSSCEGLAVAGDDEERVVDAYGESDHGGDGLGEGVEIEVEGAAEEVQQGQHHGDAEQPDHDWDGGGGQRSEGENEGDAGDGQGDELGAGGIALAGDDGVVVDGGRTGDEKAEAGGGVHGA